MCALVASCAGSDVQAVPATAPPTTGAQPTTVAPTTSTLVTAAPTTTTTVPRPLRYVFPFTGRKVSYGHRHHDYPASDVFGCGAVVVAPVWGTIEQTREVDLWVPKVNDPATRGGKYVSMLGGDGVRYYFAHLDRVDVAAGDDVDAGTPLGVMGQTGDARNSACHTHVGISWPCPTNEWAVRRGKIWPWPYLDAWRMGAQRSPAAEVAKAKAAEPDACNLAGLTPTAGEA